MAHGKLISKRPFKPNIDSLLVKDNVSLITARETSVADSNTTTSTSDRKPETTASQNNVSKAPEEQSCTSTLKPEWSSQDQNIPRKTEVRKPENIQLTNILEPHPHDVLCGRGNYVNYHAGNQYYRSLVKKYFLKYVSSSKHEKPRYAELIYHEVGMRDPPGRFLRQDSDTKLWQDVGEKKALDKTRQALREGAPEVKSRVKYRLTNEEKLNLPGEQVDALSYNSTSSPPPPNDIIADYTGSSPLDRHMRPNAAYGQIHRQSSQTSFGSSNAHMQYQQINQTLPSNNGVSLTNAQANERSLNRIVSMNSVGVNDCQAGKESRFATNTAAENQAMASSVSYRLLNSNPNTVTNDNIANLVALGVLSVLNGRNGIRSEALPPVNTIARGSNTANAMGAEEKSSLLNTGASEVDQPNLLTRKRAVSSNDTNEKSKRQKSDKSLQQFSAFKDSVGAAALLAMSCGDDGKTLSHDSDSKAESISDTTPTPLTSAVYSEPETPRNILTEAALMQGFNGSSANELLKSSSIWDDKIQKLEKKWEILQEDSKTYPQRITAIEEKALQYRKRIKDAAVSTQGKEKENGEDNEGEGSLKIVELAEEKWGLIPPQGYNLAERVKMVEQTAISQIKRLQLWI